MAGNTFGQAASGLGELLIPQTMQGFRDRAAVDQQARQNQVGNAAAMSFLRTQGMEGTPATKQFQVNGKTYGQNAPATKMGDPLSMFSKFAGGGTPLQSIAAQRAMNELFPQPVSPVALAQGAILTNPRTGETIASNPAAQNDTRPEFLKVLDTYAQMAPDDPRRSTIQEYLEKQTTRDGGREIWSNPVAEIGPDGKPVQVRYGSLGGRRVETGATPARQGNAFDRQDYWRGQFKPILDAATDVGIQSAKVGKSLDLDTGTGHIAAINALQKMIDQGAVVRDQDVALIQSAQSFLEQRKNDIEKLKTGRLLGEDLQNEMRDLASALESAIYEGTLARMNPYQQVMTREGVDMRDVLPDTLYSRFTNVPQAGKVPKGTPVAEVGQTVEVLGGTATRVK